MMGGKRPLLVTEDVPLPFVRPLSRLPPLPQNAYFPLFITEDVLMTEKEHVEGFAPEVRAHLFVGAGRRARSAWVLVGFEGGRVEGSAPEVRAEREPVRPASRLRPGRL